MSMLSSELRRAPDWWHAYKDPNVRVRWLNQAKKRKYKVRTPSASSLVDLSENQASLTAYQIQYVIDELAGYTSLRDNENQCQVSCFERIWESDTLLLDPGPLLSSLDSLRGHAPRHMDNIIVPLIDYHLHPLVYGQTLVSSPRYQTPQAILPTPSSDIYTLSSRFALLPSEVVVPLEPHSCVRFASYINNLHPDHTLIYDRLSDLLSSFIPLFEHVLTDLHRNNPLSQRIPGPCRYNQWEEPEAPEFSDDEGGWVEYEREMRHWIMHRPIEFPDVPITGYQGGLEKRRLKVNLRGRTLQIFVHVEEMKLVRTFFRPMLQSDNHVQEPGNSGFPGSLWHVEGMRNERIVACGLHFLTFENLTSSNLQFRMAVTYPRGFPAGDTGATLRTWGLQDGDACHQHIGSVPVRPGLGIVFPNIYQHRQSSFTLADRSKTGQQTVIAFFLVDPDIPPIISTAQVPPQQRAWIHGAVRETLEPRLPVEIVNCVLEWAEGLASEEEAQKCRAEVREERERFRRLSDMYHFCLPFDIWNGPEIVP
ncbi:hypothetical protein BD779DRAFT_1666979 [Infundibulicybe gibba]|nr:hypothetical protein BD779DRAFT_1666979 [Infundibulicybe gibba]